MVILHVASKADEKSNGASVIVPQHVINQGKYQEVRLVNIRNIPLAGDLQLEYKGHENFPDYLEAPFCKPDLVVFHEANYFEYIRLYKNLLKRKIPYIILPHGELTRQALKKKYFKKKLAYLLFFNRFVKHAAALQCLSQNEADNVKFKNFKFIATNGVTMPDEKKTDFSQVGLKIVYVGRLDYYHKGFDIMFEGLQKVGDILRENQVKVDLYGPDLYNRAEKTKELISRFNVGDIVTLNDAVYDDEKRKILLDADIFIQTSRFEGMPLGILEALSLGLPCIVTEGTTLGGVIKSYDAGWVAKTDPDSLSKAIALAIEERGKLSEKSENAVKAAEENFGWDKVVRDALGNYEKILQCRGESK